MSLVLNVEILGEFKRLTQATTGAETSLKKLEGGVGKISNSINGTLAAIGVGFSLGAVISGIKDTINAASDLEQNTGALESVFKDLSPEMSKFAKNLAPIGLSASDASKNMALLGAQLKGYGLDTDTAADKTKELTLLAADLAATFGGTTSEAVSSISALFRGEYDPIEKYGVAIKKSDVNARLAAEGLSELEGEALKQAEAQAALALLFEKTADAQGQSARESETYASQQAYLRAESENLKAQIGEALLPAMVELFTAIRDNLPEIKDFIAQAVTLIPLITDLAIKTLEYKEAVFAVTTALTAVKVALTLAAASQGGFALSLSNAYFLGAALVLGGIAAGMITVYDNTKKANTALDEQNRLLAIKNSLQGLPNPTVVQSTPYTGIIPQSQIDSWTNKTVVPKVNVGREQVGGVVINNNINVSSKSQQTADEIAAAINARIKQTGSSLLIR